MVRGIWCHVMQSAEVPSSLAPNCSKPAGCNPITTAGDIEADILCVLQDRLLLSNTSVTRCCADAFVEKAATTAGSVTEALAVNAVAKYAVRAA